MKITVDSKNTLRPLENFWTHIHFHPTDAIEDQWGRDILDRVAGDGAARYVRIYSMFEDMVGKNKSGELVYDFTLNDRRMDYLVSKGFKLLVCFNFMPLALAKNPGQVSVMERYKGKRINFSEPADYHEWQEVCYTYASHLIQRYGLERVSTWYMHCWNEPDHCYWLNDNSAADYSEEKLAAYTRLYDHFAAGISKASTAIKIGGPSAASNRTFIEEFILHTKEGTNHATGETGTKIDFFSVHTYSMHPSSIQKGDCPSISKLYAKVKYASDVMKKYGYADREILIDEWGPTSSGFISKDKIPEVVYRDTEYFPAFYAKLVDHYIRELPPHNIRVSKMMICLSGQHNLVEDFDGYRSFFTLSFYPKPIYNGYAMLSKLGDNLLEHQADRENDNLGVIPTLDGNGNCKILMYYTHEDMRKNLENCKVSLQIKGLSGSYRVRHYRIDHLYSNAHTKWLELGKPEKATQLERENIKSAGRLSLYYPEEVVDNLSEYMETVIMTKNSLSLIELDRV